MGAVRDNTIHGFSERFKPPKKDDPPGRRELSRCADRQQGTDKV
jgi:hypothetical protein